MAIPLCDSVECCRHVWVCSAYNSNLLTFAPEVLQSLKESDPWEDEDIDEILAAADSSGDGELQIQDVDSNVVLTASLCLAGTDGLNGNQTSFHVGDIPNQSSMCVFEGAHFVFP